MACLQLTLQVSSHQDQTAEDQEVILSPLQEPSTGEGTVTAVTSEEAFVRLEVKGTGLRDR